MVLSVLALIAALTDDAISVRTLSSPRDVEVRLELEPSLAARLSEEANLGAILTLSIVGGSGKLPVLAKHELCGNQLILRPRYPLAAGASYLVQARLPDGTSATRVYRVPTAPPAPPPRVKRVFPSSHKLPANCLKFYIHFSGPMRQGRDIFEHIQLVDDRGHIVADPWRRAELWNATSDRLTLWIHPGRVKQGVNLREDFGPVLKPNRRYRLIVTAGLRDLAGTPLERPYVKEFDAIEEDHESPDVLKWQLSPVRTGSRDPLVAVLNEPLDRALLLRLVTVTQGQNRVAGSVATANAETRWTFIPRYPWPSSQVVLRVSDRLEDLAGNTPARVFDTDLTRKQTGPATLEIPVRQVPPRSGGKK